MLCSGLCFLEAVAVDEAAVAGEAALQAEAVADSVVLAEEALVVVVAAEAGKFIGSLVIKLESTPFERYHFPTD